MADSAGKLEKLSRLKSLKSGLQSRNDPRGGDDALSFDGMFGEGEKVAAKPAKPAPEPALARPAPAPAKKEDETESLSAYFEALGIVPDGSKKPGTTGTPPKPYTPPSAAYTKPADRGRDVDARDRWADPVREDESYLSSFAGDPPVQAPAPIDEAPAAVPPPAPEEKASGFTFTEPAPEPETAVGNGSSAEVFGPPEAEAPASESPDAVLPEEAVEEAPIPVADEAAQDDFPDDVSDESPADTEPDFGKSIDIDAFERELAMADVAREPEGESPEETDTPPAGADADEPLSIAFDPGRAAMLRQVSEQMGCSVDDVVVTAIDWYLDALLGDETQDDTGAANAEA